MKYVAKILIYIGLIIAVNMVLLNIFHVEDYIAVAVSIAIVVFAATYEFKKK